MSRRMSRLAAIALFLISQAGLTSAAEAKVFSTIGVQGALEEAAVFKAKGLKPADAPKGT